MRLQSDLLTGTLHGFFTRRGGVSTGHYNALNCGLSNNDDPAAITENRRRVMQELGLPLAALTSFRQIHGNDVLPLNAQIRSEDRPKADGMVTATPGVALGVLGADCAPILFSDPVAKVIGAAHSGWKGTLLDIGTQTLLAMEALGATRTNIQAVIGPAIAGESYEVAPDFPAPFIEKSAALKQFFSPSVKAGHHMFDLTGCIAFQLQQSGIGAVQILPHDTYREADLFFSNRRTTHLGEGGFGLQISVIALPEC